MTKQIFLDALELELKARFAWAQEPPRLERYMSTVREMLAPHGHNGVEIGEATIAAARTVGVTGKVTYKALRALPEG